MTSYRGNENGSQEEKVREGGKEGVGKEGCERGRVGNTFITLKTKKSLDDHYICHHLLFKKLIEKVDAKILSCCMLKIIYNMHKH